MHLKITRVVSELEVGSLLISALQMTLLLNKARDEQKSDGIVSSMDATCTTYKADLTRQNNGKQAEWLPKRDANRTTN